MRISARTRALERLFAAAAMLLSLDVAAGPPPKGRLSFEVSFPRERRAAPADGRVYVLLAKEGSSEPRFAVNDKVGTAQIFGVDVDPLAPGQAAVVDARADGYPFASPDEVPPGEYVVQGLLNVYETFRRKDGHVVKLPPDRGEGQQWEKKPGNLFSKPAKVRIDPTSKDPVRISLTEEIPPVPEPNDTKYLRHVKITSRLLTEFWGRPMELGAIVLLPEGFDEHPAARFPLVVHHGHFNAEWQTPVGFRTEPPGPELKDRDRTRAEYSYKLYQDWTAGRLPRMLVMTVQHANPYYDDSYAVNSANLGPYGDAIVTELIPEVERRFRGIGEPWARVLTGGSTGGWEALAQQVFYPDFFNGAWCACPDPVDFRQYELVNVYEDRNAFWLEGPFKRVPRPAKREPDGHVSSTVELEARYEAALGSKGRSTEQWDIWQAVYGPVGKDGYPKPIWDKKTGVIDKEVAAYWKERYDLRQILERDWKTLGPKLAGKLRVMVGDLDTFYLDNAVRLLEKFLETTTEPYWRGKVTYGHRQPHCWWGDPDAPARIGSYTANQRLLPEMAEHVTKTAPIGADVMSWKY